MNEILKGVKVVELATILAGPSAASFFGELGAEVIKVEPPEGDGTRTWKLASELGDASSYFYSANWSKRYTRLNLKSKFDYVAFLELIKDADILIANFKPGSAEKMQVDYVSLQAANPRLIYINLIGYSAKGKDPAFDLVIQAETGFMYMNGMPGGDPIKMPVALMDVIAAHQIKEAALLGLYKREEGGKGFFMEVSLYKSGISALANQAANYLNAGVIAEKAGSLHPNIAPYGEMLQCGDGQKIVLAVGNDQQFAALCKALGVESLAVQEHYASNPQRVIFRKELLENLNRAAITFSGEELLHTLKSAKVPCACIADMPTVFLNPLAQEMIHEEEINGVKSRRVRAVAFRIV